MKIQSGRFIGWLIVCMLGVAAIVPVSRNNQAINANSQLHTVSSAPDAVTNRHAFKAIDQLQVGQRVLTGVDSDSVRHTAVDSSTWKKLSLTAEYAWTDGTRDTFQVVTLQSPQWLDLYSVSVGAQVPMPLDVQEMGCPDGLMATVESIEPCPPIQHSPGRVILSTVNHLNAACRTLTVQDQTGRTETIQTTDYHPFWSETQRDWVKAYALSIGDSLRGEQNRLITLIDSNRIPSVHKVYNLTVESEHVYRVGLFALLVHNTCFEAEITKNKYLHIGDEITYEQALDQVSNGADVVVDNRGEALRLAQEVSGGQNPIWDGAKASRITGMPLDGHYHPVDPDGAKLPPHIVVVRPLGT